MVAPQTPVSISGSAASSRFEKRLEIIATLLLAFATVGSAWSAYQAKRWGGVQMFRLIASNGARSEAVRLSDKAPAHLHRRQYVSAVRSCGQFPPAAIGRLHPAAFPTGNESCRGCLEGHAPP